MAQDPIGDAQPASAFTCNVCLEAGFSITKPDVEIYTGQANKMWKCREFEIMASNGEFGRDVCAIVQGYALRDCGCEDGYGSPPPEQPIIDLGSICNVCGGENGSDLDQVTYPEAFVDTGVGISAKCGFLYTHGFMGAFTKAQCDTIQKTVGAPCGCGTAAAQVPPTAAPVSTQPPTSSTISSPTGPPPTVAVTASPTSAPTQGATPTQAPAVAVTPAPTITATTTPPTRAPTTASPAVTVEPTPIPTTLAPATPQPTTQQPTALDSDATTNEQPPPTYAVSTTLKPTALPTTKMSLEQTTSAPVDTPSPTTNEPTTTPSEPPTTKPCLASGEACTDTSDCCRGLCLDDMCDEDVLSLTSSVTSSAWRHYSMLSSTAMWLVVALLAQGL